MILKFFFFPILIGVYWIPVIVYGEGCENLADFAAKEQCCRQNGLTNPVSDHYSHCNVCKGNLTGCPVCYQHDRVECIDHLCQCKKGFGTFFGMCQPAVGYNERCDRTMAIACEDTRNLLCDNQNFKCVCFRGYEYDTGLKQCIHPGGDYGYKCRTNPDSCNSYKNLECKNNYCVTKFGYWYDCKNDRTFKGNLNYSNPCNPDTDPCNPDFNYDCINAKCACRKGYYLLMNTNDTCMKYREHGDDCNSTTLCDPEPGLECKYNACGCKEGYNHNPRKNNCEEIKPLIPFWVWKWLAIATGVIVILVLFCYVIHSCRARRKEAMIQARLKREKAIHIQGLSQSQGERSPSIHKHHSRSQSQGVRSSRKKSRKHKDERKKPGDIW